MNFSIALLSSTLLSFASMMAANAAEIGEVVLINAGNTNKFLKDVKGKTVKAYYTHPAHAGDGFKWIVQEDGSFQNFRTGKSLNLETTTRSYTVFDHKVNAVQAQAFCEGLDTNLATITSEAENDKVARLCASTDDASTDWLCWIGLHDSQTEGGPEWQDGTPLVFQNWNTRASDNNGSLRDHVVIGGTEFHWMDYGGWEYNLGGSTSSIKRTFVCNGKKKRKYKLVDTLVTGVQAQEHCESLGMNLATITSQE